MHKPPNSNLAAANMKTDIIRSLRLYDKGQKTDFYYDHTQNKLRLMSEMTPDEIAQSERAKFMTMNKINP